VRELAGLLLFGERLVIHSAHEWRTVSQQFRLTVDLIEAGAFGTTPLAVPQISPRLAAYLAAYPDGPQV
jgi:hypothetical protein